MYTYPDQLTITLEITPSIIRQAKPSISCECIIALATRMAARRALRDEPMLTEACDTGVEIYCGPDFGVLYRAALTPKLRVVMRDFDFGKRIQPQRHTLTLQRVA